jgi:hypothetical protein
MTILTLAESPEMFLILLLLGGAVSSIVYSWRSRRLFERMAVSRNPASSGSKRANSEHF